MESIQNDFINNKISSFSNLAGHTKDFVTEMNEYVLEQFELVNQNEKVKYYYKHFYINDSTISDYCNKIISIHNIGKIMTQIRFKNLKINEPFIEILFSTFEINTNNIKQIIFYIKENYQSIKIRKIRFFSKSLNLNIENNNEIDRLFYASFFNRTSYLLLQNSNQIQLEIPSNNNFYAKYLHEYGKVNKEFSQPLSFKTIQALIDDNLFYVIKKDAAIIGVIATDTKYINALKGFEISDEIIYEEFRGNSFGRNAQNLLINKIISIHPEVFVIGTIHPDNIASIKTAESNERKCLGAWFFLNNLD